MNPASIRPIGLSKHPPAHSNVSIVGDVPADFYLSNSPDVSNTIVWTSPDGQMAFCLDGFFSKEELIDMAEHVRPCDPESVEK